MQSENEKKYLALIWGFFIPFCYLFGKIFYTEYTNVYNLDYQGSAPDFLAFWAGVKMAVMGQADLAFNHQELLKVQHLAFPNFNISLPWHNPPVFFFYLWPFAYMDFYPAYILWVLLTTLFCCIICSQLVKPVKYFIPLILCTFPFYATLANGQASALLAGLWGAIALGLLKNKKLLAGFAVALLIYKPQYGVFVPFALLAGKEWKAFGAAAFFSLILILASIYCFGMDSWSAFFEGNKGSFEALVKNRVNFEDYQLLYSVYGIARYFGGLSYETSMALQGVTAFLCFVGVIVIWRKSYFPLEIKLSVLIFGCVLSNFYVYWHDLFVFIIPALLLYRSQTEDNKVPYENYIYIASAFLSFTTLIFDGQVIFISIFLLGYILVRRIRYYSLK